MKRQYSDEELTAFLDGELPFDKAALVEKAVSENDELCTRLEALRVGKSVFLAAADDALRSSPDYSAPKVSGSDFSFARIAQYAAILLVGIVLGTALPIFWGDKPNETTWMRAVADYQLLYVEETLADASQSDAKTTEIFNRFGAQHGLELAEMRNLPKLQFKRAQILGYEGRPLLQIAYATQSGQPVALCIVRVDEQDRKLSKRAYGALPAYEWVKDGNGFILIGEMSEAEMKLAVDAALNVSG